MIDVAFAIPGDLDAATGGYAFARKLLQLLPEQGVTAHHIELPGSFPNPSDDDLATTRRLLAQIHPETPILFDGLAFGAMPEDQLRELEPPVVALVHHPLALETGLPLRRQRRLLASERGALALAEAIIATSRFTARTLSDDYDVAADRITIAEPGTAPAERATGTGSPFTLLAVGALIPRKGYGVLIDSLGAIGDKDWQLTVVGSSEHDPDEANRIREQILESGLRRCIRLAGRVSGGELNELFRQADLFVMPSLYEGYGMVLAEAMARGLAIVCTTGGAAAETVPDGAALKVRAGDAAAFGNALQRAMKDDAELRCMRDASWVAGKALPRWPDGVARIADVMKSVARERRAT